LEIADQVLLIDPWLAGNPVLDDAHHAAAVERATHILVTHGHFDHISEVPDLSKAHDLPVSGMYELVDHLVREGAVEGQRYNRGGTITLGEVTVSLVPASHSSSAMVDGQIVYLGQECGLMIRGEGRCVYVSGDTDIMADMDWMGDYYKPDIGILSAGGHFTMDMAGAAYAARRYFDFKTVIACHYRTFPLLEQTADRLVAGLPGVEVLTPDVMETVEL
jgi:L-ascorbate metabolism protein UlaG (beta-lactamase superfamily)